MSEKQGRTTKNHTKRRRRIDVLRRRAVLSAVLAVALIAGTVAAGRAASDREQSIRLAFGQKAYEIKGEEGPQYYEKEYSDPEELREDGAQIAAEILREGIVLLKNDGDVLPLRRGAQISVFGRASVKPVYSSSAEVSSPQTMKDALEEEKIHVNDKLWDFTDRGGGNSFSGKVEKSFENFSEAAVVVIGRSGSSSDFFEPAVTYTEEEEPKEVITGAKALQLTEEERGLFEYVNEHFDTVIAVLNTENPMEMGFIDEYNVDACLWTGDLGQNGMKALAEVLSGKVNPSGGLPDTYVYNSFSSPAAANLGDYSITSSSEAFGDKYLSYSEGMYVGYRYYETRYEDAVQGTGFGGSFDYDSVVAYPFGHGLSYTSFELGGMKMAMGKKGYEITVEVRNTGDCEGKEIVQFYLQRPYTNYASENGIETPSAELVGFAKTKMIAPGESEKVKMTISEDIFRTFDAYGKGTYILDEGTCLITAAQDAHAAVNNFILYKGKGKTAAMSGTGDGGLVEKFDLSKDYKTYSDSSATGEKIRTRFREADPLQYDADFVMLSRKNWEGTWPSVWQGGAFRASSSFLELLRVSSGEDNNAGAPVYNTAHGEKNTSLAELRDVAFDDYRWGSMLDQLTWRETYSLVRKGGGLVNEVLSCSSPQALISEYAAGLPAKYGDKRGVVFPSPTVMAATWNTDLILQAGHLIGEEALQAGITYWQLPSLNLHRTPMGGRNCDSFSEDSFLTGRMAAAICRGLSGKGVIPVIGKMVLRDQEINSTGVCVMISEQALRELYLRPFEIALRDGGSGQKAIMAGMNRIGPRWCGGHAGLLTDVLRGEWGFTGIVMTDKISEKTDSYADILEGLEAGTDLWQNASNNCYKLKGGVLTYGVRARFRNAAGRILRNVSRSNAMNGIGPQTILDYKAPHWKLYRMLAYLLAFLTSAFLMWYSYRQWRRARAAAYRMAQKKREAGRRNRNSADIN